MKILSEIKYRNLLEWKMACELARLSLRMAEEIIDLNDSTIDLLNSKLKKMDSSKPVTCVNSESNDNSDMLASSIKELQFEKTQQKNLMTALEEMWEITGELEKCIIINAKEKYRLNQLSHAKKLFSKLPITPKGDK